MNFNGRFDATAARAPNEISMNSKMRSTQKMAFWYFIKKLQSIRLMTDGFEYEMQVDMSMSHQKL